MHQGVFNEYKRFHLTKNNCSKDGTSISLSIYPLYKVALRISGLHETGFAFAFIDCVAKKPGL